MTLEKKDYFENVEAYPLGKRRLSRLSTKRVLKEICKKKNNFEIKWKAGKASFMTSFPFMRYPKKFASPKEKVEIQVSIRLIPGETSKNSPVDGLSGLEVYYRFKKIIAIKNKEKKNKAEEETTEFDEFENDTNVVDFSEWQGTTLHSSSIASDFYKVLETIGVKKVKEVLNRVSYPNLKD